MEGGHPLTAPLLQVDLSAGYGKHTVLSDVSFDLHAGQRLGLLGSSGAGKSTLLLALFGLLGRRGGWARGEVLVGGRNLLALPERELRQVRGRHVALVPQSPLSALNPALSLFRHFEASWMAHRRKLPDEMLARMHQLARCVDLPCESEFWKRKPGQISVGQAQRCALALALLHRPSLIVADEPTSALDPVTQTEVLRLLQRVSEDDGSALLFVSHDLFSVFRLCSEVAVLSQGRLHPAMRLAEIVSSSNPELHTLVRALPLPVEVLLEHLVLDSKTSTKVPMQDTLLTLQS